MIRAEQGRSFQLGKVGNRFRDGRRIKLFLNSGVIGLLEFSEQISNFDDKAKGAFLIIPRPPKSTLLPYATLCRPDQQIVRADGCALPLKMVTKAALCSKRTFRKISDLGLRGSRNESPPMAFWC